MGLGVCQYSDFCSKHKFFHVFPQVLKPKHSFCFRKECVNGRVDGLTSAAEEPRSQAFTLVKQDELSLKVRDLSGPVSCGDSQRVSAS